MAKRTTPHAASIVVAGVDPSTLNQILQSLSKVGISARRQRLQKGWKGAPSLMEAVGDGNLLIAADPDMSPALLDAVRQVVSGGGFVGVWSAACDETESVVTDAWLGEQLLMQRGGAVTPRVASLAVAIRIRGVLGKLDSFSVCLKGKRNGVAERLADALAAEGVDVAASSKGLVLFVDANGDIAVEGLQTDPPLGEPKAVAEGVALLLAHRHNRHFVDTEIRISEDDVDLIAQPPPRLLSETASKKLLSAFGLTLPFEQLCQSPSEAARVAAGFPGPAVLKLVKPRLENKQDKGAVILGVEGTAQVRRAAQVLESLGASMGAPAALGVLTAAQITGGLRVWVRMERHRRFGRILQVGQGDRPTGRPVFALQAPCSVTEVFHALLRTELSPDETAMGKIAVAISRFSKMVDRLKGRVCRAEIHPLAAVDGVGEALVLDALAEVGPD